MSYANAIILMDWLFLSVQGGAPRTLSSSATCTHQWQEENVTTGQRWRHHIYNVYTLCSAVLLYGQSEHKTAFLFVCLFLFFFFFFFFFFFCLAVLTRDKCKGHNCVNNSPQVLAFWVLALPPGAHSDNRVKGSGRVNLFSPTHSPSRRDC